MGDGTPRVVITDLGGVVVECDTDRLILQIAQTLHRSFDDVWTALYDERLLGPFERGEVPPERFYEQLRGRLPLAWTFQQFVVFWNNMLTEKPDVTALYGRLAPECRLVALSNTNILHLGHIRQKMPALQRIDLWIGSCDVGCCKPDPRIYRHALEQAGVAASEAVYVDDRPEMVEGARRLGLDAIRFETSAQLERELASRGLLNSSGGR